MYSINYKKHDKEYMGNTSRNLNKGLCEHNGDILQNTANTGVTYRN